MKPIVSVIMPVYNAEKYLANAIESILRQSFDNFELLLIDDGSTDNSGNICDMYVAKDARVRGFHQANAGRCCARNLGLEMASGKYIAFCDDDDEYEPDLLQDNITLAMQYNADVVRFYRRKFFVKNDVVQKVEEPKQDNAIHVCHASEIYSNMSYCRSLSYGVWSCIFDKNFLSSQNIKFDRSYQHGYEDNKFIIECYYHLQTIVYNAHIYYNWYWRKGQSDSANINLERLNILDDLISTDKKLYFDKIYNLSPSYWTEQCAMYVIEVVRHLIYTNNVTYQQKRAFLDDLKAILWENDQTRPIYKQIAIKYRIIIFLFYHNCYMLLLLLCRAVFAMKRRG